MNLPALLSADLISNVALLVVLIVVVVWLGPRD